jgi:hypothetical protein
MSTIETPVTTEPVESNASTVVAIVAVALAVIAVTLMAVVMQRVGSQTKNIHGVNNAAAATSLSGPTALSALAAAKTEVAATLTYNYTSLQTDIAAAEKNMTPAFKTT